VYRGTPPVWATDAHQQFTETMLAEYGKGTSLALVVGSGIEFTDRGTHHLKGVPDPWQLYAVARQTR